MEFKKKELSQDDLEDIKYLFDYVDEDKDGLVTIGELRKILIEAEIAMDFDTLLELIDFVNPEKKEKMDINTVIRFFEYRPDEEL